MVDVVPAYQSDWGSSLDKNSIPPSSKAGETCALHFRCAFISYLTSPLTRDAIEEGDQTNQTSSCLVAGANHSDQLIYLMFTVDSSIFHDVQARRAALLSVNLEHFELSFAFIARDNVEALKQSRFSTLRACLCRFNIRSWSRRACLEKSNKSTMHYRINAVGRANIFAVSGYQESREIRSHECLALSIT